MSILIKKNQSNTAIFTLNEKTTLTGASVYYLFKFTSDDTRESVLFTGQDAACNTCRYNEFLITETGTTYINLTASTINLEPIGFWSYTAYEQTSATNLDISGTTSIVETGKVYVSGDTKPTIIEYTGSSNETRSAYFQ